MSKGVKKIKIRSGRDSNRALVRKLLLGFITNGRLTTTLKRAKIAKSEIDKLVYKSREKNEATKNVLLRHLADRKAVNKLFDEVGPKFKQRTGGYVKLIRLGRRMGDGSETARLEWIESFEKIPDTTKTVKKDEQNVISEKEEKSKPVAKTAKK